jgi:hypothetical protein
MARGGKRPGAGRPEGKANRPSILEYWNGTAYPKPVMDYFAHITKRYKKSDKLATWVGDQLCGKAMQPIGGDMDLNLRVVFDSSFDATPRKTKKDSK